MFKLKQISGFHKDWSYLLCYLFCICDANFQVCMCVLYAVLRTLHIPKTFIIKLWAKTTEKLQMYQIKWAFNSISMHIKYSNLCKSNINSSVYTSNFIKVRKNAQITPFLNLRVLPNFLQHFAGYMVAWRLISTDMKVVNVCWHTQFHEQAHYSSYSIISTLLIVQNAFTFASLNYILSENVFTITYTSEQYGVIYCSCCKMHQV